MLFQMRTTNDMPPPHREGGRVFSIAMDIGGCGRTPVALQLVRQHLLKKNAKKLRLLVIDGCNPQDLIYFIARDVLCPQGEKVDFAIANPHFGEHQSLESKLEAKEAEKNGNYHSYRDSYRDSYLVIKQQLRTRLVYQLEGKRLDGIQVCDLDLSEHIVSLDTRTDLLIESLRGEQLAWLIDGVRKFYDIILVDLPSRFAPTGMMNVFATANYFFIPLWLGNPMALRELLNLEEIIQGFIFKRYPIEFGKVIPFFYEPRHSDDTL